MFDNMKYVTDLLQLLISCGTFIAMVYALGKFLNRPQETQDDRINAHDKKFVDLETRLTSMEKRLNEGAEHFTKLDDATSLTQSALVTIMDSLAILVADEKTKTKLTEKRDDLVDYLVNKR